jgi:hypothetical protein
MVYTSLGMYMLQLDWVAKDSGLISPWLSKHVFNPRYVNVFPEFKNIPLSKLNTGKFAPTGNWVNEACGP